MSRYIDADALLSKMVNEPVKAVDGVDFYAEWFTRIADTAVQFTDMVKNAPTVDAVPVVHAHWRMYSYDEAICSHCGYDRLTEFESTSEAKERWGELPKFCENCGARMDGADGERRSE